MGPRVRFAPSPTGQLHVGNARTALFNWIFARRCGGHFVLRIEDTDQERVTKIYEKSLMEDLRWLSMNWDEGPEAGGKFGPYHQIERIHIYESYLKKLIADDNVYPCYCSDEELEAERTGLLAMRLAPRYTGKCRKLTDQERKKLEMEGKKPAFRFKVAKGAIDFDDLIRGAMKFKGEALGDFIIVRSNGIPAYNFAVVIDDHLMKITHVIRGEDHLSNTALQLVIYRALGFHPPQFAHHSLILGKDRAKLSKRHGSVSVREFREKGILPEALLNYLALLGSSLEDGKEIASIHEIIDMFSFDRAGKSGAVFDENKLRWLNAIYIRHDDIEKLIERLTPFIREAGYDVEVFDHSWLCQVVEAVRDNLVTLCDIGDCLDIFFDEKCRISDEAAGLLNDKRASAVIEALYDALNYHDSVDENIYDDLLRTVQEKTGLKGRDIFMPVRAAVTGRVSGPELRKIFSILGKKSILARLKQAIQTSGIGVEGRIGSILG
jgi:nondiscriminating glutamyl-tRNA synthetase